MLRTIGLTAGLLLLAVTAAGAAGLIEPPLRLSAGSGAHPRVALTFDACSGDIDARILSVLVDNDIPATIFVTERWLQRNAPTIAVLKARPDLFEIENHGRDHVPAVTGSEAPYGIAPAGTLEAVASEVTGGAEAIQRAFRTRARWFRGATALYSEDALEEIVSLGFRVAGFSLNADLGASVGTETAAKRLGAARDGDVVIAHINQPNRPAGAGIARGILDLKQRGYVFVQLNQPD